MGTTGLSTGVHTHLGCYKKYLGVKVYYNPLTIYSNYMQKLIELEKKIDALVGRVDNSVNQICVMEDGSVRIKSDKNKTYHVMKTADAGKESMTSLWRLKGRDKYKESEFDGYTAL